MELKEVGTAVAPGHWYYVSKGRAVRDVLGPEPVERLLDVGAGSGVFSRQMVDAGLTREAICVDPNYEVERDVPHGPGILRFRREAPGTAPLILMMDVLEHVDDDLGLVRTYLDPAAPGSRLLVTVPAFQSLWSGHDDFLEHRRRYRVSDVDQLLAEAGLRVRTSRYFFGAMFPAVAAIRLIDRIRTRIAGGVPRSAMRPLPAPLNRLLTTLHDLERRTVFPANRLAGVSVVALAEKP